MRTRLILAAAGLSLAPLGALAAPTSMMNTLPRDAEAQPAPATGGGVSWLTKWFRDPPPQEAPAFGGPPAGVMAYQPPTAAARPGMAMPPQQSRSDAWQGTVSAPPATTLSETTPLPALGRPSTPSLPPSQVAEAEPADGGAPADDARSLRERGHALDRSGDLVGAERFYRQAIGADPTSAAAVNDLGLCLARRGDLESSAAVLKQAITMRPDKPLYRNNVATVLVELGHEDEALTHLKAAYGQATAHYNLGHLLARAGKTEAAAEQWRLALAEDPTMGPARQALAQLAPVEAAPAVEQAPVVDQVAARPAPAYQAPAVESAPAVADITPIEPDDAQDNLAGAPSFPRLLPPVLGR